MGGPISSAHVHLGPCGQKTLPTTLIHFYFLSTLCPPRPIFRCKFGLHLGLRRTQSERSLRPPRPLHARLAHLAQTHHLPPLSSFFSGQPTSPRTPTPAAGLASPPLPCARSSQLLEPERHRAPRRAQPALLPALAQLLLVALPAVPAPVPGSEQAVDAAAPGVDALAPRHAGLSSLPSSHNRMLGAAMLASQCGGRGELPRRAG